MDQNLDQEALKYIVDAMCLICDTECLSSSKVIKHVKKYHADIIISKPEIDKNLKEINNIRENSAMIFEEDDFSVSSETTHIALKLEVNNK